MKKSRSGSTLYCCKIYFLLFTTIKQECGHEGIHLKALAFPEKPDRCCCGAPWSKTMGYTDEDLDKPIVGIINTWAETNPGPLSLSGSWRKRSSAASGAAGGFPLEVNTMSICEVFFDISSLIFRNLLSMTTEELIERHPFDGVVLMGSCDKNVPAQLMAAGVGEQAGHLPAGRTDAAGQLSRRIARLRQPTASSSGRSISRANSRRRTSRTWKAVFTAASAPVRSWEPPTACSAPPNPSG